MPCLKNSKLSLSLDYEKVFKDKVIIITGVGRSGTSIISSIVGSFKNVVYLYEPVILASMPVLYMKGLMDFELTSKLLKSVLFEDYYLQILHGRSVNFNKADESYIGKYQDLKLIKERWKKYRRRNDVMKDVNSGKYCFIFKVNEMQHAFPIFAKIFKNAKFIHIVRNGNDVISSSINRGWYSDEYLNSHAAGWIRQNRIKVPWFISEKDSNKFCKWNDITRTAYIWRTLVNKGTNYGKTQPNYLELKYEDLIGNPGRVVVRCEKYLNLKRTNATFKNVISVKKHKIAKHPDLCDSIDKKERPFFKRVMEEMGYSHE